MIDACVIGYGIVGNATAEAFGIEKHYSRHEANITLNEAAKCRYIFICLPTPTVNGEYYTKDIYDIVKQISTIQDKIGNIFIIRSTVYPGFNKYLQSTLGIDNIVSNPEFLSEDTAVEDAKNPDLVVLGSESTKYLSMVAALYKGRFRNPQMFITDSTTAEMIKLTLNNFFSLKVIFGNVIFDFANKVGANYEEIRKVLEFHKWGSKFHFKPIYKGKRGLHGKCLPKDLDALAHLTNSPLFNAIREEDGRIKNA